MFWLIQPAEVAFFLIYANLKEMCCFNLGFSIKVTANTLQYPAHIQHLKATTTGVRSVYSEVKEGCERKQMSDHLKVFFLHPQKIYSVCKECIEKAL